MTRENIHHASHGSEVPQMKTIGILGGMGQWATLDIQQRILRYSATRINTIPINKYTKFFKKWYNSHICLRRGW